MTGITDNVGWTQYAVTYRGHAGTIGTDEDISFQFYPTGFRGSSGEGTGDMLKEDYDDDDDGKVNEAEVADLALSVAYANVTGAPIDPIAAALIFG